MVSMSAVVRGRPEKSGRIHPSMLNADGLRLALSGMSTPFVPSNLKACPTLPGTKARTPLENPRFALVKSFASPSPRYQETNPDGGGEQDSTPFLVLDVFARTARP